jgi:hypothetical protein
LGIITIALNVLPPIIIGFFMWYIVKNAVPDSPKTRKSSLYWQLGSGALLIAVGAMELGNSNINPVLAMISLVSGGIIAGLAIGRWGRVHKR